MGEKVKVMLVEDELLVRLGIRSLVDWERHSFDFIGEAADGEKALELMERQPPDILLTDIVMPRMDGLELIERVKALYPHVLILVLSSYGEFDYVRRAMKLGIEDYVLKTSIKPAVLLELLKETAGKLERGRGTAPSPLEAPAAEPGLAALLEAALAGAAAAAVPSAAFPPGAHRLLLLRGAPGEAAEDGARSTRLAHLVQAELQSRAAAVAAAPDGAAGALLRADGLGDDELRALIAPIGHAAGRWLGIPLTPRLSPPLSSWEAVRTFAEQEARAGGGRQALSTREDIRSLLEHMGEHYREPISLKEAARRLRMTEAYLSTLFKRETGSTFTDWVNRLRIDKAAELLRATDQPSYLISEQVGYENINYFGRIFKKIKGVSPQQYRTRFRKGMR
ncbi:response regulator [Paenibacillus albicereus]|uniref:Response regulator n=1 Tax=Paenibacillus albicereus TaxID=2726185 RepID=A0A6H2GYV8_9BACL|nr:response regulator [Paenibacillus albicereus]QJC52621.1 response regulator [Paenibacillus albicereus]